MVDLMCLLPTLPEVTRACTATVPCVCGSWQLLHRRCATLSVKRQRGHAHIWSRGELPPAAPVGCARQYDYLRFSDKQPDENWHCQCRRCFEAPLRRPMAAADKLLTKRFDTSASAIGTNRVGIASVSIGKPRSASLQGRCCRYRLSALTLAGPGPTLRIPFCFAAPTATALVDARVSEVSAPLH